MNTSHERFRQLRQQLGLTMEKMGKMVGLTKGAICQLEQGQIPLSARHIKVLCLVYGVNESWLRTGDGDMFMDRAGKLMYTLENEWDMSTEDAAFAVKFISASADQRRRLLDALAVLRQW